MNVLKMKFARFFIIDFKLQQHKYIFIIELQRHILIPTGSAPA